ncbi:MAG: type II methionyl aminopeptidase, partial [Nanoarchaeota archaeon]|nr:type II methionyl aminopeptidase [Nanoarchaeota archaeon]
MVWQDDFKKAGSIASQALQHGKSLVKEGALVVDILDRVEEFILSKDAGIAFPAQISHNAVAAHACSTLDDKTTIQADDVVKLDFGVHVNGFIGDNALTVNLSGEHDDLIKASRDALNTAVKMATPGTKVGEIGGAIQDTITGAGFSPVRNLSGHGLGQFEIHTSPSMPNIRLEQSDELQEEMTIAIEPFATTGKGAIADSGMASVFTHVANRPVRSPHARAILSSLQKYNGLPFAMRWLEREFGSAKTRLGLRELERAGAIISHPPLKEIADGLVAQS